MSGTGRRRVEERRVDRRIGRTRAALIDAARSLMRTRAWHRVSVRLICDTADVSRSAFYEHHDGKEALLDAVFEALGDHLGGDVPGRGLEAHGTLRCLPALVSHMRGHLPLFERGAASPSGLALSARFRDVVDELARAELRESGLAGRVDDHRAAFIVGGVFGTLERWCRGGCEESEVAVLAELDRCVADALRV